MASTDEPTVNKQFAKEHHANFPILSDPSKEMSKTYGVLSSSGYDRRWTFYIDAEGVIRKIDKSVSPRTAGADLVSHLEELGFPKKTAK